MSKRVRKPTEKQLALIEQMKQPTKPASPPPKKQPTPQKPLVEPASPKNTPIPKTYSFAKAIEFLNSLPNSQNSLDIWVRCLTMIGAYARDDREELLEDTVAQIQDVIKDDDILELLNDYEKTINIIDEEIKNKITGEDISGETRKQYYVAIETVSMKKGVPLDKEVRAKYSERREVIEEENTGERDLNKPKRAIAKYPDLTWEQIEKEYDEYVSSHNMTKKYLRLMTLAGLYVVQRPRRLEYRTLKYYEKMPKKPVAGENFLVLNKNQATLVLDEFKTRWRVKKGSKERKQQLPTYTTNLKPRLASLFREYIKKWEVKNGGYIFYKEKLGQDQPYEEKGMSKYMTSVFKQVFDRDDMSINTFRHLWNTFVSEHFQEYNDAQIKQLALDVGDTDLNLPSHLRYRITNQANQNKSVTEIARNVIEQGDARRLAEEEGGSEGSVGDINEVQQPAKHVELDRRIQDLASAGAVIDAFYTLMRPVLIDLINRHRE